MKNLLSNVGGLVLLVAAVLFAMSQGWHWRALNMIRGAGAPRPSIPAPSLSESSGQSGGAGRSKLRAVLKQSGVKVTSMTPRPGGAELKLRWRRSESIGRADQALALARRRKIISSFRPVGRDHIDVRTYDGRPVYVGRYTIRY